MCTCPGARAVFSFHCSETQIEFRVKDLSLLAMCYPVISPENLFKSPCFPWVEFTPDPQLDKWPFSKSIRAVFTHQLKVSMDYEQLEISDYLAGRVTTPLWYRVESPVCWEPSSLAAGWQNSLFPSSHFLLGKVSRPEDFGCIAIWWKSQDNSILVQGPSKTPAMSFWIMRRNMLYLEITKRICRGIFFTTLFRKLR